MAMDIRELDNRLDELFIGVEAMVWDQEDLAEEERESQNRAERLYEKVDQLREILGLIEQAQRLAAAFAK